MTSPRGADLLAQTLKAAGVARIFTLSGNHIMPVFDACLSAGIELIHVRHEAAAVHMADAYARLTGRPAVALVTGGPGHANAVGALYTALMCDSPVVLLSGHAPHGEIGRGAFQEMRQADMAAPTCKAAWTAASADSLGQDMTRALNLAASGRPGPVHVSLPTDALDARIAGNPDSGTSSAAADGLSTPLSGALMQWLGAGRRPLVLAGPLFLSRAGRAALAALEDAAGVPVVGMESPRGVADPSLGAFAEMLPQADRVLLLAKRVDFTLKFGNALGPQCQVAQIDPDEPEIARARKAFGERLVTVHKADPTAALTSILRAARKQSGWKGEVRAAIAYRPAAWDGARASRSGLLHPVEVLRPAQALLDSHPDSVFVSDGGEFGQWAQACLNAPQRVINGPAGAIGPGLPFAMAARLASPHAPVVAAMGDGTFGFHAMEIDTAVRHGLPFVALIGNDARWNAEYQIQLRAYGPERKIGCELLPSDYHAVAAALGGWGARVSTAAELAAALPAAQASARPAVINAIIEGLAAPMVSRGV
ncbi:MAG: thiamine pyrophosphate-binding protein [Burkholderiales bacterium]|nr:thiamine pyrophosphate-binding protein [Burkholderiales bacterium]